MRFRFAPLDNDVMGSRLRTIADQEDVLIDEDGIKAVVKLSRGDMRSAVNMLQSVYMVTLGGHTIEKKDCPKIDEETVYRVAGQPSPQDVECIMRWLMNEDFSTCATSMFPLFINNFFSLTTYY